VEHLEILSAALAVSGIQISTEDLAYVLEMDRIVSMRGKELSLKEIKKINLEYYKTKKNG
jgi:hypothetical protein